MILPKVLAGPFVRRAEPAAIAVWIATHSDAKIEVVIFDAAETLARSAPRVVASGRGQTLRFGRRLHVALVIAKPPADPLPVDRTYAYDVVIDIDGVRTRASSLHDIAYPPFKFPTFVLRRGMPHNILHGSCRKPHGAARDATLLGDSIVGEAIEASAEYLRSDPARAARERPNMLFLTGDQIYADDVAKDLQPWLFNTATELVGNEQVPMRLPRDAVKKLPAKELDLGTVPLASYVGSSRKDALPTFTSTAKDHHLIGLGEFAALYLMGWNPAIRPDKEIKNLITPLEATAARRLMANIVSYMMLDDHEVSDDWNITREWVENTNVDALAQRVIANALTAFYIFQAWGNDPSKHRDLVELLPDAISASIRGDNHALRKALQAPSGGQRDWTFRSPPAPEVLVLDTRTHRRFPKGPNTERDPPALLDIDAAAQLGKDVAGLPPGEPVLIVSPAPLMLAPTIDEAQAFVVRSNGPYDKDFEGWCANTMGMYRVKRAIHESLAGRACIVLSGDVHHAYGMHEHFETVANRKTSVFVQFTSSALKNPVEISEGAQLGLLSTATRGQTLTSWVYTLAARARPAPPSKSRIPIWLRPWATYKKWLDTALAVVRALQTKSVALDSAEHFRVSEGYARVRLDAEPPDMIERRTLITPIIGTSNIGRLVVPSGRRALLQLAYFESDGSPNQWSQDVDLRAPPASYKPNPDTSGVTLPPFDEVKVRRDGSAFGRILFANFVVNDHKLTKAHERALELVKSILLCSPGARAFIEGRASQTGEDHRNQQLSELRAGEVANYLVTLGVPSERIKGVFAYGAKRPLVDHRGFEEDLNRSVHVTFEVPAERADQITRIKPPVPIKQSKDWAIWVELGWSGQKNVSGEALGRLKGVVNRLGAGIAGGISYALLWDKANHELYSLLLPAFGVGAGINIYTDGLGAELEEALGLLAQVDLGTFEDFTTREAYSIRDFHGTLFHMDTLEANAMIGLAYAHLWFPSLDVIGKDIDIGGWQLGNVGIGASHVVGPVVVLGRVANPNIRL